MTRKRLNDKGVDFLKGIADLILKQPKWEKYTQTVTEDTTYTWADFDRDVEQAMSLCNRRLAK